MKNKVLAGIFILVLTGSMIVGCGKKKIAYSLDGGSSEASSEYNDDSNNALAKFRDMENWVEEWQVIDKNGKEVTLKIDAEIVVPDLEDMHMIEVERINMDKAFKEQVLQSLFGDAEIYYHEMEHRTKEELRRDYPDDIEVIETGLDTPAVAKEIESVTHYAAYQGENLYDIYMSSNQISIWPHWEEDCGPEQFHDYKMVSSYGTVAEDVSNECQYTMEEAREIADAFMKDIGLGSMECTGESQALWRGTNDDYEKPEEEIEFEYACYGYSFGYGTKLDENSDGENARPYEYNTMWTDGYPVMDYDGEGGGISIRVTDAGIVSVYINTPEYVRNMSGPVEFLPLDSVMKIMKNDVASHSEEYDFMGDKNYNRLELRYMSVKDDSQENTYSYIPVWCLAREDERYDEPGYPLYLYHPTFVNAIDGMVLFTPGNKMGKEICEEQMNEE